MKQFYDLVPHLPKPATPHAKQCLEKIKALLTKAADEKPVERQAGQDDEEVAL